MRRLLSVAVSVVGSLKVPYVSSLALPNPIELIHTALFMSKQQLSILIVTSCYCAHTHAHTHIAAVLGGLG